MQSLRAFTKDGEKYTLRDSIEYMALGIAEDFCCKDEHQREGSLQACHVLDTLANAYNAINR